MIPRITKETHFYGTHPISSYGCYVVTGKHGSDECYTLSDAIRYWLWHCGVPARIAFWRIKKK